LTGQEAGRLVVQNYVDKSCGKPSFLTEQDVTAIYNGVNGHENIRGYNKYMALSRALTIGFGACDLAAKDACLNLAVLIGLLKDVNRKKAVDLFSFLCPQVVSRKQYEDISAAQKERKLTFEYSLGYVIEERFYAIAPPETREQIDELGLDIDSAESLIKSLPDQYRPAYEQAIAEIYKLYREGLLKVTYEDENTEVVKPLLDSWKQEKLSNEDAARLTDMLFVTGSQLYCCNNLPEWKDFIEKYQTQWFSDEDERFRHDYAILENCSSYWLDEKGHYKASFHPSEWVTRGDELALGLTAIEDEEVQSVDDVNADLLAILKKIGFNARLCLALKVAIDASLKAAGIDWEEEAGSHGGSYMELKIYVEEYNHQLKELKKEKNPWKDETTKLETVLCNLPSFDLSRLTPSSSSLERLREGIFDRITDDEWLRREIASLEYDDSFTFRKLLENGQ
jgi:hypothetical protein